MLVYTNEQTGEITSNIFTTNPKPRRGQIPNYYGKTTEEKEQFSFLEKMLDLNKGEEERKAAIDTFKSMHTSKEFEKKVGSGIIEKVKNDMGIPKDEKNSKELELEKIKNFIPKDIDE